ncbi:MAG: hypothetical protein ACTS22_00365 [Phycisphaerales bacterium]
MADDKGKAVKIAIIVICLAGAAVGLYLAFGPSGTPNYTTGNEGAPPDQTDGSELAPPDMPPPSGA